MDFPGSLAVRTPNEGGTIPAPGTRSYLLQVPTRKKNNQIPTFKRRKLIEISRQEGQNACQATSQWTQDRF